MSDNVFLTLERYKFVPLIVLEQEQEAVMLASALISGGLPIAEVTFRTDAAARSIFRISEKLPECLVGAGTVHNVTTAKEAVDAGAKFIVTPGINPAVVDWCLTHDIPVLPGCVTPADLEVALDFGLSAVKFFPAEAYGGVKTLKALQGPYADLSFMPTGGIDQSNALDYLSLENVFAVGGSFMAPAALVKEKRWAEITQLCRMTSQLIPERFDL